MTLPSIARRVDITADVLDRMTPDHVTVTPEAPNRILVARVREPRADYVLSFTDVDWRIEVRRPPVDHADGFLRPSDVVAGIQRHYKRTPDPAPAPLALM